MPKSSYLKELKFSFKLAVPLMISLLIQTGLWVVDSIMMGYMGKTVFAAGSLAIITYYLIQVLFFGFTNAVGICIGQARGADNVVSVVSYIQQGIYLIVIMAIPMMLVIWNLPHLFFILKEPLQLIQLATQFLHGIVWGCLGMLGFALFREFCANLESPLIIMYISIVALPLNGFLDYGFIYGAFGLPSWGMFGIGFASSLVQWCMFISIVIYTIFEKKTKSYMRHRLQQFNWRTIKHLLQVGFPTSLTYFFEAGLFCIATLMMGWISVESLAAHQILLQCIEITFMCFVSIAQTTSIRVAHGIGRGNPFDVRRGVRVNVTLGLIIAFMVSLLFFYGSKQITTIFIDVSNDQNQDLLNVVKQFFHIAMVFVFFDSLQIIGNNALRGMKDTFIPMLLGLGSYWIVGIGSAYLFGFVLKFNGVGIWWGLTLGLAISSMAIGGRWLYLSSLDFRIIKGSALYRE